MAEVYGEKPEIFTKKWWPYFWMYYKWHTISIVAIAVFIISTVMQCVTAEKYDLILTYLGRSHISQEKGHELESKLGEIVADADSDGETDALYLAMNLMDSQEGAEMDFALKTKYNLDFYDTPNALYMVDSARIKELSRDPDLAYMYCAASEWAPDKEAENGVFVSVKDSAYLKQIGVNSSDMYVAVRRLSEDADDTEKAVFDNAVRVAQFLIK